MFARVKDGLVGLLGPDEFNILLESKFKFDGALSRLSVLVSHTSLKRNRPQSTHLHLLERALILLTPGQGFGHSALFQRRLNDEALFEQFGVYKCFYAKSAGQLLG